MQFSINRLPRVRPAALAFALAFAAIGLATLEGTFRLQGFQPSLSDTDSFWADARERANNKNTDIILVGSSLFQSGIAPTELGEISNKTVINLAIHGSSPSPVLIDLANSKATPETVIVEYLPKRWVNESNESIIKSSNRVSFFHHKPYASNFETFFRTHLRSRWVVLHPMLNIRTLPRHLLLEKNADGTRLRIRHDRFVEISGIRPPILDPSPNVIPILDPIIWINGEKSLVTQFEQAITSLQARGVKVIIFDVPLCSQNKEFYQNHYGEPALFNELKRRSQAIWLAADELKLEDIECTDGLHLTTKSAHAVTNALGAWLNAHHKPHEQPAPARDH